MLVVCKLVALKINFLIITSIYIACSSVSEINYVQLYPISILFILVNSIKQLVVALEVKLNVLVIQSSSMH